MFGLESGTRYFICQHPVSMRKGIDSLFNLVVSESPMSPMTGDVFVFFSKNRQPAERIVKYFQGNGFDLDKQTAHGLLKKTAELFDNLYKAMRIAVKEGAYLNCDESYHTVLIRNDDGIEALSHYGDVEWDNKRLKRINRYISLSRHNFLFFGSHEGAKRGCVFYSLACSCRCNGINFFDYLSDVLNKAADLPHLSPESLRNLLTDKWTKE